MENKVWWQVYYQQDGLPKTLGFATRDGKVVDAPDWHWKHWTRQELDTWMKAHNAEIVKIGEIMTN